MPFDSFTIQPPPAWAQEGALLYCGMAVIVAMFAGKAAGMVLLGALAAGVGPLGVLMMPRVALAVGLVIAWIIVRRYGWRWVLATMSFVAILGVLVIRNLELLGAQAADPMLVFAALVDAVIATVLIWFVLVACWVAAMFFGGKFLLLFRSGLSGERQHRQHHAEVQAAKAGRTKAWQWALSKATGGRYQPPQAPTKGSGKKRRRGGSGGGPRTVPTSRPASGGPAPTPRPKPRPGPLPVHQRPAARRARARRAQARKATP
jgi:hypothetical protein